MSNQEHPKIERCSCEEAESLKEGLRAIVKICTTDTKQSVYWDRREIFRVIQAFELLSNAKPCSCDETLHYRRAVRACSKLLGLGGPPDATLVDDIAQVGNFADQGLRLEPIEGDPGVYDASEYVT